MKKLLCILSLTLIACNAEFGPQPQERPETILILGNSIARSNPNPDIGWFGTCGMAASSPQNDFVHLLQTKTGAKVTGRSIAAWENDFSQPANTSGDWDYTVIRIGENVTNIAGFGKALNKLIKNCKGHVIITGMAWWNNDKDSIIEQSAFQTGVPYISLEEMWGTEYRATQYSNPLVSIHPNDLGMDFIATKIAEEINNPH